MSLLSIFKISYYFDNNTGSTFTGFWVVVALMVLFLVASLVIKKKPELVKKFDRRVVYRLTRVAFIFAWVMLLWLFFRYEGIPYLSWRLWPAILLIWAIYEKVMTYRLWKYELPARRSQGAAMGDKEKYLRRFQGKRSKK